MVLSSSLIRSGICSGFSELDCNGQQGTNGVVCIWDVVCKEAPQCIQVPDDICQGAIASEGDCYLSSDGTCYKVPESCGDLVYPDCVDNVINIGDDMCVSQNMVCATALDCGDMSYHPNCTDTIFDGLYCLSIGDRCVKPQYCGDLSYTDLCEGAVVAMGDTCVLDEDGVCSAVTQCIDFSSQSSCEQGMFDDTPCLWTYGSCAPAVSCEAILDLDICNTGAVDGQPCFWDQGLSGCRLAVTCGELVTHGEAVCEDVYTAACFWLADECLEATECADLSGQPRCQEMEVNGTFCLEMNGQCIDAKACNDIGDYEDCVNTVFELKNNNLYCTWDMNRCKRASDCNMLAGQPNCDGAIINSNLCHEEAEICEKYLTCADVPDEVACPELINDLNTCVWNSQDGTCQDATECLGIGKSVCNSSVVSGEACYWNPKLNQCGPFDTCELYSGTGRCPTVENCFSKDNECFSAQNCYDLGEDESCVGYVGFENQICININTFCQPAQRCEDLFGLPELCNSAEIVSTDPYTYEVSVQRCYLADGEHCAELESCASASGTGFCGELMTSNGSPCTEGTGGICAPATSCEDITDEKLCSYDQKNPGPAACFWDEGCTTPSNCDQGKNKEVCDKIMFLSPPGQYPVVPPLPVACYWDASSCVEAAECSDVPVDERNCHVKVGYAACTLNESTGYCDNFTTCADKVETMGRCSGAISDLNGGYIECTMVDGLCIESTRCADMTEENACGPQTVVGPCSWRNGQCFEFEECWDYSGDPNRCHFVSETHGCAVGKQLCHTAQECDDFSGAVINEDGCRAFVGDVGAPHCQWDADSLTCLQATKCSKISEEIDCGRLALTNPSKGCTWDATAGVCKNAATCSELRGEEGYYCNGIKAGGMFCVSEGGTCRDVATCDDGTILGNCNKNYMVDGKLLNCYDSGIGDVMNCTDADLCSDLSAWTCDQHSFTYGSSSVYCGNINGGCFDATSCEYLTGSESCTLAEFQQIRCILDGNNNCIPGSTPASEGNVDSACNSIDTDVCIGGVQTWSGACVEDDGRCRQAENCSEITSDVCSHAEVRDVDGGFVQCFKNDGYCVQVNSCDKLPKSRCVDRIVGGAACVLTEGEDDDETVCGEAQECEQVAAGVFCDTVGVSGSPCFSESDNCKSPVSCEQLNAEVCDGAIVSGESCIRVMDQCGSFRGSSAVNGFSLLGFAMTVFLFLF